MTELSERPPARGVHGTCVLSSGKNYLSGWCGPHKLEKYQASAKYHAPVSVGAGLSRIRLYSLVVPFLFAQIGDNTVKQETPNPVHRYIGNRLFELRSERVITLQQLATTIRVTSAHLRAIEFGHRKLPIGHMFRIARTLNIDVGKFYEGMEEVVPLIAIAQYVHCTELLYLRVKLTKTQE